ncbi:MAG: hypothetical protein IKH11_03520, partial [Bacteroidales bacterium]|nr:hypothetical protein [Bacteroidales bacterium]
FIAVGGDGTIHEVMSGLLRFSDARGIDMGEFTLGVLPYGTGNDWIRSSRTPKDISAAANCILKGNTAKEDIVRLTLSNGVFCMANIGGIGLDADICYYTNHLKRRGHKGGILYKLVAPYSVFSKKRRQVLVECDGELVYKGRLFSAVIGNGVYRGGGLRQNADGGNWNDGKLELSIMGDVSAFKAVQLMLHVFSGDFAVQPGIISRQFRRLTVTPLGKPDRVESDGEIPGVLPLTVEYTGQQINIIVP